METHNKGLVFYRDKSHIALSSPQDNPLLRVSFSKGSEFIGLSSFNDSDVKMDLDIYEKSSGIGSYVSKQGYKSKNSKISISFSLFLKEGFGGARDMAQVVLAKVMQAQYLVEDIYTEGGGIKKVEYLSHKIKYQKGATGNVGELSVDFVDQSGLWTTLGNPTWYDYKNAGPTPVDSILTRLRTQAKFYFLADKLSEIEHTAIRENNYFTTVHGAPYFLFGYDFYNLVKDVFYISACPFIIFSLRSHGDGARWFLFTNGVDKYCYYYLSAEQTKGKNSIKFDFLTNEHVFSDGSVLQSTHTGNTDMTVSVGSNFFVVSYLANIIEFYPQYQYTL